MHTYIYKPEKNVNFHNKIIPTLVKAITKKRAPHNMEAAVYVMGGSAPIKNISQEYRKNQELGSTLGHFQISYQSRF